VLKTLDGQQQLKIGNGNKLNFCREALEALPSNDQAIRPIEATHAPNYWPSIN
jgi:hypothetical protein